MLASNSVVATRPLVPAHAQAKLGLVAAPARVSFALRRADTRRCVEQRGAESGVGGAWVGAVGCGAQPTRQRLTECFMPLRSPVATARAAARLHVFSAAADVKITQSQGACPHLVPA